MPVLTVVAGPNGAGKSTNSRGLLVYTGLEAFDFDKEFYILWSAFSFDPSIESGVFDRTQNLYDERKNEALLGRHDFAFETNYHTPQILNTVEQFQAAGYTVELIYIALEHAELAIERVKERVSKGGHSVDENTIRERFAKGLDLLDASFDRFDTVYIYQSVSKLIRGLYILEPKAKRAGLIAPIPTALKSRLPRLTEFVAMNCG